MVRHHASSVGGEYESGASLPVDLTSDSISRITGAKITGLLHHRQTHLSRRNTLNYKAFDMGNLGFMLIIQRSATAVLTAGGGVRVKPGGYSRYTIK
jgi:hypothetical protein